MTCFKKYVFEGVTVVHERINSAMVMAWPLLNVNFAFSLLRGDKSSGVATAATLLLPVTLGLVHISTAIVH